MFQVLLFLLVLFNVEGELSFSLSPVFGYCFYSWATVTTFGAAWTRKCDLNWVAAIMPLIRYAWLNCTSNYHHWICFVLGNCEHVWMVTSIRLHHPHDLQSVADYPRTIGISYFHKRKCLACTQYAASWMLVEDEYLSRSPAFFCDRCLREFHYDAKGKKLGNFKALHFVDPSHTNLTWVVHEIAQNWDHRTMVSCKGNSDRLECALHWNNSSDFKRSSKWIRDESMAYQMKNPGISALMEAGAVLITCSSNECFSLNKDSRELPKVWTVILD